MLLVLGCDVLLPWKKVEHKPVSHTKQAVQIVYPGCTAVHQVLWTSIVQVPSEYIAALLLANLLEPHTDSEIDQRESEIPICVVLNADVFWLYVAVREPHVMQSLEGRYQLPQHLTYKLHTLRPR